MCMNTRACPFYRMHTCVCARYALLITPHITECFLGSWQMVAKQFVSQSTKNTKHSAMTPALYSAWKKSISFAFFFFCVVNLMKFLKLIDTVHGTTTVASHAECWCRFESGSWLRTSSGSPVASVSSAWAMFDLHIVAISHSLHAVVRTYKLSRFSTIRDGTWQLS